MGISFGSGLARMARLNNLPQLSKAKRADFLTGVIDGSTGLNSETYVHDRCEVQVYYQPDVGYFPIIRSGLFQPVGHAYELELDTYTSLREAVRETKAAIAARQH